MKEEIFEGKGIFQHIEECSLKRVQRKDLKWNLQNKKTNEIISDVWFDYLDNWSSFSAMPGEEHDIYGWSGAVFLEEPFPTYGAYPFGVKSKNYNFSSIGELESIYEYVRPIYGFKRLMPKHYDQTL
jgi:hypothetical protein